MADRRAAAAIFTVALVVLVTLATAASAAAETTIVRHPFAGPFFNPCTGETVVIEGTNQIVTRPTGMTITIHGTGVSSTGARYVFVTAASYNTPLTPSESSVATTSDHASFIRQGSALANDDFHGRFHLHVTQNANGEVTVAFTELELECDGEPLLNP